MQMFGIFVADVGVVIMAFSSPEHETQQAIVRMCKLLKSLVVNVEVWDVRAACIAAAFAACTCVCNLDVDGP